jgi:hypothetical protein
MATMYVTDNAYKGGWQDSVNEITEYAQYDARYDEEQYVVFSKESNGGTLGDYLVADNKPITFKLFEYILYQVGIVLAYMNSIQVTHFDATLNNWLVDTTKSPPTAVTIDGKTYKCPDAPETGQFVLRLHDFEYANTPKTRDMSALVNTEWAGIPTTSSSEFDPVYDPVYVAITLFDVFTKANSGFKNKAVQSDSLADIEINPSVVEEIEKLKNRMFTESQKHAYAFATSFMTAGPRVDYSRRRPAHLNIFEAFNNFTATSLLVSFKNNSGVAEHKLSDYISAGKWNTNRVVDKEEIERLVSFRSGVALNIKVKLLKDLGLNPSSFKNDTSRLSAIKTKVMKISDSSTQGPATPPVNQNAVDKDDKIINLSSLNNDAAKIGQALQSLLLDVIPKEEQEQATATMMEKWPDLFLPNRKGEPGSHLRSKGFTKNDEKGKELRDLTKKFLEVEGKYTFV